MWLKRVLEICALYAWVSDALYAGMVDLEPVSLRYQ